MQLPYANLKMRHWNPGATMPLVMNVHVICNTSDADLYDNVRSNAAILGKEWIKVEKAHDRVAVLCGSGPSIKEQLGEIRERQAAGQVIFAMNGCAKFLADHGIMPDYQVILDAREGTADLIGPAKEHLFASQVHPECFRRQPDARLWHLQIGGIENEFPTYERAYALIGGAASVGNTATCPAYAMGYRNLQIYGYDSSHRDDQGHAFNQPMNNGDPCCVVLFGGKEYTCSLTMKLQAEKFQETSRALIQYGCHVEVHGDGLLPDMFRAPREMLDEAAKYEKLWGVADYRNISPGEESAGTFLDVVKPDGGVIDFGCGTGRGALRIADSGVPVTMVDFAANCLDDAAKKALLFIRHDLTEPLEINSPYGYCTDVMEHIPTDKVDVVLQNIIASAPKTFFQISTVPDNFGTMIGQMLHLTVRPHEWWREKLRALGCHIAWEEAGEICSSFYVKKEISA